MRWVLATAIDDEEVIWLNEYTQSKIDAQPNSVWGWLTPHPYMAYVYPNYSNPIFYSTENDEYFNDLFAVEQKDENGNIIRDEKGNPVKKVLWDDGKGTPNYGISRGNLIYKLWMNFRNKFGTGAVCGGISKSGHCIRGVNAIASTVIGQPGHAALLYYNKNSNGQGYWGIDNNISGWAYSEKGERMSLGWGNDRTYVSGYNMSYMVLAQEALNDYNNFAKAEEILMTVDLYEEDKEKQEEIYKEAIDAQSINLDAWAGRAKLYMGDNSKTAEDCYKLAKEMMEALKNYPLAMYQLSNYVAPKITADTEYSFKFTLLQTKMLNEAKNYTGSEVLQPDITRVLATTLLGQMDTSLASFSFDGEDAEKIVLSNRFAGTIVRWDYSLDGRQTWKEVDLSAQSDNHKQTLTQEEIDSITEENDIYVHIVGANYDDENTYKIDITKPSGVPTTLFANDLENRVVGATLNMQWRYVGENLWRYYKNVSPNLAGNKEVEVRICATGTTLASDSKTFTFTEDSDDKTRAYIPVSHLSIHAVSTEAVNNGGSAIYAIDGNYNTRWHSAWNGTDTERYITIKLDHPAYISAVEFVPAGRWKWKNL